MGATNNSYIVKLSNDQIAFIDKKSKAADSLRLLPF